jgi:transcriptional regulator with XRE-family HTH domain
MPKTFLTAAQREADAARRRQKEFIRILDERRYDGISHKEIAIKIGVSPTTISDWKREVGGMSIHYLRKLIVAADLTDEEVLRIIRGKCDGKKM